MELLVLLEVQHEVSLPVGGGATLPVLFEAIRTLLDATALVIEVPVDAFRAQRVAVFIAHGACA